MPCVKGSIGKKYVPETGRREYPLGVVDKMEVDPRPAGKGKRTMGY